MNRRLLIVFTCAMFFVAGCGVLGYVVFRPQPRMEGEIETKGNNSTIRIYRDKFGVAHVLADNDADAFFGLGFVQAQDRPLLLELERLVARGKVSEVIGKDFMDFDRMSRVIGFYRIAEKQIKYSSPTELALTKAFTDGINAGIKSFGDKLPVEFRLLGIKPQPWTPTDCLAAAKFLSFGLSMNYPTELLMYKISRKVGAERARTIMPYVVPKPEGIVRLPDVMLDGSIIEASLNVPDGIFPRIACNNWAVSGARTVSGKPLLAYDAHQWGSHIPGEVFLVHLRGKTFDFAGGAMVGLPGVYSGHNRFISWGMTNLGGDCQDLYIEKIDPKNPDKYLFKGEWRDMEKRVEKICWADKKAPGGKACEEIEVRETVHGPVVTPIAKGLDTVMTLKWSGLDPSLKVGGFFDMPRARNWEEFRHALDRFELASQNWSFADIKGNIAYQVGKPIPLRPPDPGRSVFPVPGWEGKHEWVRHLTLDELPHVINPPVGFIATANHNPNLKGFDHFIGPEFAPIDRHDRIVEILSKDKKFKRQDMMDMQNDIKSLAARRFLKIVLPDLEGITDAGARRAVELLKSWDYECGIESVPAMLYHALWKFAAEETFRDEMGDELTTDYLGLWSLSMDRYHLMIENPDNKWFDDVNTSKRETRRDISHRALTKAIEWLDKKLGGDMNKWEWGRMHVVRLYHWFDPKVKLFNVGPAPYGGNGETLQRASFRWQNPFETYETAILRIVADFSDTDHVWAIIPSGQSGWWLQRNYSDQWPMWLTGGYLRIPMNDDEIKEECPHLLLLKPAK